MQGLPRKVVGSHVVTGQLFSLHTHKLRSGPNPYQTLHALFKCELALVTEYPLLYAHHDVEVLIQITQTYQTLHHPISHIWTLASHLLVI